MEAARWEYKAEGNGHVVFVAAAASVVLRLPKAGKRLHTPLPRDSSRLYSAARRDHPRESIIRFSVYGL